MGAQPAFGCWKPQATVGVIKQFYSAIYSGEILRFNKPLYSCTLSNTISLPKGWTLGADFNFTTAGDMQNMSLSSTNQFDLMIRKSFLTIISLLPFMQMICLTNLKHGQRYIAKTYLQSYITSPNREI